MSPIFRSYSFSQRENWKEVYFRCGTINFVSIFPAQITKAQHHDRNNRWSSFSSQRWHPLCLLGTRNRLTTIYPPPPGPDVPLNPIAIFFSPPTSRMLNTSNPPSPEDQRNSHQDHVIKPTSDNTIVNPYFLVGQQLSLPSSKASRPEHPQELPSFNSILNVVRPLLSRSNQLKFQPGHSVLGSQHRCEYDTTRARRTKRPRFDHLLQCSLKAKPST